MLDRHWESIAAYCHPENKVSLGLVEGLNNKIRVLQRRAYSFRDEDYLKNSKSSSKRLIMTRGDPEIQTAIPSFDRMAVWCHSQT